MSSARITPFMDKVSQYQKDTDLLKHWHYQAAMYLSMVYRWDYQVILGLIKEIFIPNQNGFKEAKFKVFLKNEHGDRYPSILTAREFFHRVNENNWILSPSFVAYKHTSEEKSVNSIGTEQFIEFRKVYKGKRQEAIAVNDSQAKDAFNEIQNALKIFNNAQSGAMSSTGTPLNNKSGHTTLSSSTRVLTSTANLLNERLITGNRLLLTFNKTMELFVSTLAFANRDKVELAIQTFGLNHATVPQIMDMVKRCAKYYWNNPTNLKRIEAFLKLLTPLELTIVLCTLDIKGLHTVNPEFITRYLREWCYVPPIPADAKLEDFTKPANGDYKVLCVTKLGAKATPLEIAALNSYHLELESKYKLFIEAFFKSKIPPSGIFSIKEMVRENVPTSDTDSMIYSIDSMLQDCLKDENYADNEVLAINGVIAYFIRCISLDQHSRFSTNLGVEPKYRRRLNMKNEYLYASYATTMLSKHYFALKVMVEGVIMEETDLENKGVHLRGIKIAERVRKFTQQLMRNILDALHKRQKMSAPALLKEVADIERDLINELNEGGFSWLTKQTIKEKSAYSNPDSSVYFYHELWESVFAGHYGKAPDLPYKAYKVVLDIGNATKLNNFLASTHDPAFAERFKRALVERKGITSLYIPTDIMYANNGIPKELIPVIDIRTVIAQNLNSIYIVLQSLGLHILNAKTSRLISDEH